MTPASLGEVRAVGGWRRAGPSGCRVRLQQDRPGGPLADGAVDGAADRGWQRDEDDLVALAADPQHAVAVLLAEVVDVGAGGLEDPQAEQSEHGDQREVVRVGRVAGGGEHGLELQVAQSEGGDSAGTFGRRTYSAGECSSTPSMTQVR